MMLCLNYLKIILGFVKGVGTDLFLVQPSEPVVESPDEVLILRLVLFDYVFHWHLFQVESVEDKFNDLVFSLFLYYGKV